MSNSFHFLPTLLASLLLSGVMLGFGSGCMYVRVSTPVSGRVPEKRESTERLIVIDSKNQRYRFETWRVDSVKQTCEGIGWKLNDLSPITENSKLPATAIVADISHERTFLLEHIEREIASSVKTALLVLGGIVVLVVTAILILPWPQPET